MDLSRKISWLESLLRRLHREGYTGPIPLNFHRGNLSEKIEIPDLKNRK